MKTTYALLLIILSLNSYAQDISGSWSGILKFNGQSIPVIFNIAKTSAGYQSTMDSPAQGAKGIQVDKTEFENTLLSIEVLQAGIKYEAAYLSDSSLFRGKFKQGGLDLPLELRRASSVQEVRRPQDPRSFPYRQEELSFRNTKAGITLSGTLTSPPGAFDKLVILISGSGPQDRNSEIKAFNHRPFLVWSDWLSLHGVAVFRFDERGVAKSGGNFQTATTADFAEDVEAAVDFLKSKPALKHIKIGLLGHSEGGMIAPMLAAKDSRISFLVLLAAPGVPFKDLLMKQQTDIALSNGIPQSKIDQGYKSNKAIFDSFMQYKDLDSAAFSAKLTPLLRSAFTSPEALSLSPEQKDAAIKNTLIQHNNRWFRYAMNFSPLPYLERVSCPVLALNGTLDLQVSAKENLAGIRKALLKAKNKNHQEIEIPGLNHLFQRAKTGNPLEYARIEETVNPEVMQKVTDWLKGL